MLKINIIIEEQNQCLEESQNCFEIKVVEGFKFIDLIFLIEQLRRGCCTSQKYNFSRQLGFLLNNKKRSHTQLDSRKQVIAFQDRVITIRL